MPTVTPIGRLAVRNSALFLATLYIHYTTSHPPKQTTLVKFPTTLPIRTTTLLSPHTLSIPSGSTLRLLVSPSATSARSAKTAPRIFRYEATSAVIARYAVSGFSFAFRVRLTHVALPPWRNWARNVRFDMRGDDDYLMPYSRPQLLAALARAARNNMTVRVSGTRHSLPPLVPPARSDRRPALLLDMACYRDVNDASGQRRGIALAEDGRHVVVNAGVREDELLAFLAGKGKTLPTVTAGAFFSIGGILSVDAHGATHGEGIISETATALTFLTLQPAFPPHSSLRPKFVTIDEKSVMKVNGKVVRLLPYARTAFGMFGVLTRATLRIVNRPTADSLVARKEWHTLPDAPSFTHTLQRLLRENERLEVFMSPYGDATALILTWNLHNCPSATKGPPLQYRVPNSCDRAHRSGILLTGDADGAGGDGRAVDDDLSSGLLRRVQGGGSRRAAEDVVRRAAMRSIADMFDESESKRREFWLKKALPSIFMAYFIPIAGLQTEGLTTIWRAVTAVKKALAKRHDFLLTSPLEFRIVRAGDAPLAGNFRNGNASITHFANVEVIAFTGGDAMRGGRGLPYGMRRFFAEVEGVWLRELGGVPHGGKMFGFWEEGGSEGFVGGGIFGRGVLKGVWRRRREAVERFEEVRRVMDAGGVFRNAFVDSWIGKGF